MTAAPPVERVWMVYDADGGLLGELAYAIGKRRGRRHCALCDITHAGVRRKPAFDSLVGSLGVPSEIVHRNEQPTELAAVTDGRLACVIAETADGYEVLLDAAVLDACAGDVAAFGAALTGALGRRPTG